MLTIDSLIEMHQEKERKNIIERNKKENIQKTKNYIYSLMAKYVKKHKDDIERIRSVYPSFTINFDKNTASSIQISKGKEDVYGCWSNANMDIIFEFMQKENSFYFQSYYLGLRTASSFSYMNRSFPAPYEISGKENEHSEYLNDQQLIKEYEERFENFLNQFVLQTIKQYLEI